MFSSLFYCIGRIFLLVNIYFDTYCTSDISVNGKGMACYTQLVKMSVLLCILVMKTTFTSNHSRWIRLRWTNLYINFQAYQSTDFARQKISRLFFWVCLSDTWMKDSCREKQYYLDFVLFQMAYFMLLSMKVMIPFTILLFSIPNLIRF